MDGTVEIGPAGTDLEQVRAVASGADAVLSPQARQAVDLARGHLRDVMQGGAPVYGVNTGFGRLANTMIPGDEIRRLQRNLLLSHACGTGPPLEDAVVRVMLFLRVVSLAIGRSGIRDVVLDALLRLLSSGYLPVVPSQGSLGASGDLAPLAHLSLPLIGEGWCRKGSELVAGSEALSRIGMEPLTLEAKEGLALINGTQGMTAILAIALLDAESVLDAADAAGAMSVETLMGTTRTFDRELISLRPHPGAVRTAENLRRLTAGSEIVESHRKCGRVQDAYSLRCIPQVHGASRDAMAHVRSVLETELVSVTDNPLIMSDGEILSGGNFHGQPVALAADHLTLAVSELASISERRLERLLNPDLSGLPAFLSPSPGINSGLMIVQYTAASLVSENKVLSHPSSCDSISVSGSQEDHVSMGMTAARHCAQVVENTRTVIASELVGAAQALDLMGSERSPGAGVLRCYRAVRKVADRLGDDRDVAGDVAAAAALIRSGVFTSLMGELPADSPSGPQAS